MKRTEPTVGLLLNKMLLMQQRYIEDEKLIMEIAEMSWFQRMFCRKRLIEFIKGRPNFKF